MKELKPCPFCGSEAKLVHVGNEYTKKRSTEIKCTKFGCFGMQKVGAIRHDLVWTDDMAISKWNARAERPAK